MKKKYLVIVSGLAGAGKTTVIHALEDLGYYCIDNLPAILIKTFIQEDIFNNINAKYIALALDSRDLQSPVTFQTIYLTLKKFYHIRILFLTSAEEIIAKRFRETRRQHPLISQNSAANLLQAIAKDKETLMPLKKLAHRSLDTSQISVQNLKKFVYHNYAPSENSRHIFVNILSFGFKYGMPTDVDSIFDVRCFKNPHYEIHLRHLSGMDSCVKDYIFADKNVRIFLEKLVDMVNFLYPLYQDEGKSYYSIGIGCTGGKHRSVALVEELAKLLKTLYPFVGIEHRHLELV